MALSLSLDGAKIVTVRARVERGLLHRLTSSLEEDETLDAPPERRTGPPRNLETQVKLLSGHVERWHCHVANAMGGRRTATYTLRGRVRDGLLFHVTTNADEDEPVE